MVRIKAPFTSLPDGVKLMNVTLFVFLKNKICSLNTGTTMESKIGGWGQLLLNQSEYQEEDFISSKLVNLDFNLAHIDS